MKHFTSVVCPLAAAICFPFSVAANTPTIMNYQGRLTDAGGIPVANGSYSVTFTIYDAAVAGNPKWTESQNVTTTDGLFTVLLGTINAISDTVFMAPARFLGIRVEADPEISPRTMLVAVPWSFRVRTVDGSSGGTVSGDVAIGGKATIGSAHVNTAAGGFVAGADNSASGFQSVIGGGNFNTASGNQPTVGGGFLNSATADQSTVAGGSSNAASAIGSTVGGGDANSAADNFSTVGGGRSNVAGGASATISGGNQNSATSTNASVGGGTSNQATSIYATVGGGRENIASANATTVAGGFRNSASGFQSALGGGHGNATLGDYATLPGGRDCEAFGDYSIASGRDCFANGAYSLAMGRQARAEGAGSFVWADSTDAVFQVLGTGRFAVRASGGVGLGTNAPAGKALAVDNAYTGANTVMLDVNASVDITTSGRDVVQVEVNNSSTAIQYIECERGADVEFRVHGTGDVTADGSFTGGGADFAELVRVSSGAASVSAGDVMVMDPNDPGAIVRSAQPRSTLVSGVYSTKPGYMASGHDWDQVSRERLGLKAADGDEDPTLPVLELAARIDEVPLALVGIVPCKVSTENGPIRVGDLLVTAATPGHAMRDENPGIGTVLGKALEPLAGGTGIIHVLMTLQ